MNPREPKATPVPLWRLANLVRSKNAGPFMITVDIMFDDAVQYQRVRNSGVIGKELISRLYGVPMASVVCSEHDAALALKVSFPRTLPSGSVGDTDVFGGQFHGPLVELEIP